MVGRTLGHYQIVSLLGAGGMGEVYLADDIRLRRRVAVKLLPAEFTAQRERMRRFEQEARAVSTLNHPNILTIHEVGCVDLTHYIVTEFIDGQTLRQRMTSGRPTLREALDIAMQVASALAAAHEAGIVHRDLKPENIMLRRDGYVKVLDFGLAKLTEPSAIDTRAPTSARGGTEAGMVTGTARYMSPEQARGQIVDGRSDIFSLGVVLYELVAGRAPFEGASANDVIAAILTKKPPPLSRYSPDVPAELERILSKSLENDKDERYQVVKDLLLDLKRLKQRLEFEAEHERAGPSRTGPAGKIARHPRTAVLALVALVATLAGIGYWAWRGPPGRPTDSIAILPMTNAGPDIDSDYLSDGITEHIINSLSQLSHLKVTARTTAFRYKGKNIDAQAAGRELRVDAVMTGKVLQHGDTLIVQADLVNVADGTQIWGDRYNRKLSDILAVQEEIASRISEKLRLQMTGGERQRLTRPPTENTEAYQLYLKGRYHLYRQQENVKKAFTYFEQAIAKDPGYAQAYAGLADAYAELQRTGINLMPAKEAMPKAKQAAMKALALDEQLADAHISLAHIKEGYEWDWAGAEREYKRAVELNPRLASVRREYGVYLSMVGRHDESSAELNRALEIDPFDLQTNTELGFRLYVARRYDQAIGQFRKVLENHPNTAEAHNGLAWAHERKGMYDEALAELSRMPTSAYTRAMFGWVYASSGKTRDAHTVIDELKAHSQTQYISPYVIANIYVRLGDKDQALFWLERGYENRDNWMVWLKVDPGLDGLRADPRFTNLLQRVGLAP
jgi:TolB-like protein/Tfp pilus assembly protein PilF